MIHDKQGEDIAGTQRNNTGEQTPDTCTHKVRRCMCVTVSDHVKGKLKILLALCLCLGNVCCVLLFLLESFL